MMVLNHVFIFACLIYIVVCDNGYVEDKYPSNNGVGAYNPEKPLPDENVHDSHEPNDIDREPDWKHTINTIVSVAIVIQVVIVLFYIFVSRVCCIKIRPSQFGDQHPLKPWSVKNEQIYDMSERRYLSKDDAIPSDPDFDTDPEDLE
eukprot:UN01921